MHSPYADIISRIAEPPRWWDHHGCPRYDPFHPRLCLNIYSPQVTLLRIACQACHREFAVEMHATLFETHHPQQLHYGDPPWHDCVGDTMNCDDLEVLESWVRPRLDAWERHPEDEGVIDDRAEDDA
jgi:hypothetical protein